MTTAGNAGCKKMEEKCWPSNTRQRIDSEETKNRMMGRLNWNPTAENKVLCYHKIPIR